MDTGELLTQAAQKCAKEISHCRCDECIARKSEIILSTLKEVIAELVKERDEARSSHKIQQQNYIRLHDAVLGEGCTTSDFKNIYEIATQQRTELSTLRAKVQRQEQRIRSIDLFITDRIEEVKNEIGGVIGYRLQLSANETEDLCKKVTAAMQQDKPDKE